MRYHVNNDGEVRKCTAQAGRCPFEEHFSTHEEAQEHVDQTNMEIYGLVPQEGYISLGDDVSLLHANKIMLFLDIEMTGNFTKKNKNARIAELAMKKVRNGVNGYEVLAEFKQRFNPGEKMNPYASRITGLTDEILENEPPIDEFQSEIQEFVNGTDSLVVHGGKLDTAALRQNGIDLENVGVFDTSSFYKQLKPDTKKTGLSTLCEENGVPMDEAHDAMNDVEGMMGLYYKITDMNSPDFDELKKHKKLVKRGFIN